MEVCDLHGSSFVRSWIESLPQEVVAFYSNSKALWASFIQDTQLLLWDLSMDEVVVPLRMTPVSGGSPSMLSTNQGANWDGAVHSAGPLRHAPARKEVPKLAPVMAHRVHAEPLSGLLFSKEAIVTACHEGHLKIWDRPGHSDNLPIHTSEVSATAGVKDKVLAPGKGGISHLRQ